MLYDRNVLINKCLGFKYLKSKKRYIPFMKSSINFQFSSYEYKCKAIFTFTKSVNAKFFIIFFMLMYNDVV